MVPDMSEGLLGRTMMSMLGMAVQSGLNAIGGSTAGGAVTGTGSWVGGLVGWNNGPISDSRCPRRTKCVALGVSAVWSGRTITTPGDGVNTIMRSTCHRAAVDRHHHTRSVGWSGENESDGPISDSHARGSVQGLHQNGGLVGWNSSSITDSSASGDVGDAASLGESVGGLVGLNKGGIDSREQRHGGCDEHEKRQSGGW